MTETLLELETRLVQAKEARHRLLTGTQGSIGQPARLWQHDLYGRQCRGAGKIYPRASGRNFKT
jgi:hypothetical protein